MSKRDNETFISDHDLSKRFWVFLGNYYYPSSGLGDLRGCFDTSDEAEAAIQFKDASGWSYDWWVLVDTVTDRGERGSFEEAEDTDR